MDDSKLVKVIKTLEYCITSEDCRPCEYWQTFDDTGCQVMKDALELLKEQKSTIDKLNGFINGFSKNAIVPVRCKDCKYYDCFNGCMSWHDVNSSNPDWFCADGELKD